ncbi:hypothetical protein ACJJTC_015078 [Scirpophaga incertulas]
MQGVFEGEEGANEPSVLFLAKDVATVIREMTRGKSPGHDGLTIEHLRYAGVNLPRITEEDYICEACFDVSMQTINTQIHENRQNDPSAGPSRKGHTQISPMDRVCHACWLRFRRKAISTRQHDEQRDLHDSETHQGEVVEEHLDQSVDSVSTLEIQPQPPVSTAEELEREGSVEIVAVTIVGAHSPQSQADQSSTIKLLNYKRAPNTASHCIFYGCANANLHTVSDPLRATILSTHNFYIPKLARVARYNLQQHLYVDLDITNISVVMGCKRTRGKLLDFMEKVAATTLSRNSTVTTDIRQYSTTNIIAVPPTTSQPQPTRTLDILSLAEEGTPKITIRGVALFMDSSSEQIGIAFCNDRARNVTISPGLGALLNGSTRKITIRRKIFDQMPTVNVENCVGRIARKNNKTIVLFPTRNHINEFEQACAVLTEIAGRGSQETPPKKISVDAMTVGYMKGEPVDYEGPIPHEAKPTQEKYPPSPVQQHPKDRHPHRN